MHLLVGRFVFGGDDRGLPKEGFRTYLMPPMSPLNSPTLFYCVHIYSLCLAEEICSWIGWFKT